MSKVYRRLFKNSNVASLLSGKVWCSNTKCVVIIVEVPVKSQQQQQEGDGLSAFISVYLPASTDIPHHTSTQAGN